MTPTARLTVARSLPNTDRVPERFSLTAHDPAKQTPGRNTHNIVSLPSLVQINVDAAAEAALHLPCAFPMKNRERLRRPGFREPGRYPWSSSLARVMAPFRGADEFRCRVFGCCANPIMYKRGRVLLTADGTRRPSTDHWRGGPGMFGLMKCGGCSQTPEQKHYRRLHYCGTCRVIGSLYGWKSRVFLNNDAVFLGEVLSALSNAHEELDRWSRPYRSRSCFSVPGDSEDMPLSLQFAATAVLIIGQFKLADQMEDSNRTLWKLPYRLYSKSFSAASARLRQWDFPLPDLLHCSRVQAEREAGFGTDNVALSFVESFGYLAEPSAAATSLFFQHGARAVGEHTAERDMAALGHAFGALIYLLDALEDYEKDFRNENFNALRAAFRLPDSKLPALHRDRVVRYLWGIEAEIESQFDRLPISAAQAEHFSARLKGNLSRRLAGRQAEANPVCGLASNPAMTFRLRSRAALQTAKSVTNGHLRDRSSVFTWLQAPFVFASASLAAFAFPSQAHYAMSWRDYMTPALNLLFPRQVLGRALVTPVHFSVASSGSGLPESGLGGDGSGINPEGKDKGSSCCDCGCCCDGCDCCSCCEGCSCDC
jgi:hypothetical protein